MAATDTKTALQTVTGLELNQALVFGGVNLAYVVSDAAGMATAYSSTDWTSAGIKAGLEIAGQMHQEIKLFEGGIASDTLTFRILDHDDNLAATMLRGADTDANKTYLTANIDGNDTTLSVKSVSDLATSGDVYIGHERITYTGTSTAADTITVGSVANRGKNSLFGISGQTYFGQDHRLDDTDEPETWSAPAVSDQPRSWYNRPVGLYVHHKHEPSTVDDPADIGRWSTKAEAHLAWCGRIRSIVDVGDGWIEITALNIMQDLTKTINSEQLIGKSLEGTYIAGPFNVGCYAEGEYSKLVTVAAQNDRLSWQKCLQLLQAALEGINDEADVVTAGHTWMATTVYGQSGVRVKVQCKDSSGISPSQTLSMNFYGEDGVLFGNALGFSYESGSPWALLNLQDPNSSNVVYSVTPNPPIYAMPVQLGSQSIKFTAERGTWIDQPANSFPPGTPSSVKGFVQVGDLALAVGTVTVATDATATAIVYGIYNTEDKVVTTDIFAINEVRDAILSATYTVGDTVPDMKQVWIQHGPAGTVILDLLLSTSTSGYNNSTYDVNGVMGMAIPDGMVNTESFLEVDDVPFELIVSEPTPADKIIEPFLAATGRYLVWKDGQVTLVWPGTPSPYASGLTALTENNKAATSMVPERVRVDYGPNTIINRVTIEYAFDLKGKPRRSTTVQNLASIGDFGQHRAVKIKARGIVDDGHWRDHVMAPAISYFGRPTATATRSVDHQIGVVVYPGQSVLVTDSGMVDPRTGTRGITEFPAFVVATAFDWRTGVGRVDLVFLPETDWTKAGTWSPCAEIDSGSQTYGSPTTTLVCKANKFSATGVGTDAGSFEDGDEIRIFSTDQASPTDDFTRTVSGAPSGNNITISSAVTLTSGLVHCIEPDDVSAVQTSQKNHAFIADDATDSTSDGTPYIWTQDGDGNQLPAKTISYIAEYVRPDTGYDSTDEPMSCRKFLYLAESANNWYGTKSCPVFVNDILPAAVTLTGTGVYIAYGPILLPFYAPHNQGAATRSLGVRILGNTDTGSTTATFNVHVTTAPVGGLQTSTTYPPEISSLQITTTSTSETWISEGTLSTPILQAGSPKRFWLTVEITNSSGSAQTSFRGISIREIGLSE